MARVHLLDGRLRRLHRAPAVVEVLDPISTAGLNLEDRNHIKETTRKVLIEALRPIDGGVADRADLGRFRGAALGVTIRGNYS